MRILALNFRLSKGESQQSMRISKYFGKSAELLQKCLKSARLAGASKFAALFVVRAGCSDNAEAKSMLTMAKGSLNGSAGALHFSPNGFPANAEDCVRGRVKAGTDKIASVLSTRLDAIAPMSINGNSDGFWSTVTKSQVSGLQ